MSTRTWWTVGITLVLAMTVSSLARVAHAAGRTNVLFLICDDLNCDIGCYGHPQVKTPNIDRLAARGVRFERAYCQYTLCGPSRASFMTGLYPDQTLIHGNAILIRTHTPDVVTMSQHFMNNGYHATRIGKIFHYNVPTAIGTDGHDDPASWNDKFNPIGRDKAEENKIFSLHPGSFGGTLSWLAADGTDAEQTDGIAAAEAVERLEQFAASKRPFFLAVGLYRPHTPYVSPKKYFDMYPLDTIVVPTVPDGYLDTLPKPAAATLTRKKDQVDLKEDLAKQAIQAYHASITFADAQLGQIIDALDRTGLSKNTVILFTSDHGYHMGEHGYYQKTTLFENAARVPLIIATPGMATAGKSTPMPVESVDFYPTLAELCGLPKPTHASGVSLAPVLNNISAAPRTEALTQYGSGYSIRTARYRYTEWGDDGKDGNELYDHTTDPAEMHNLANSPEHKDVIAELSKVLHARVADANRKPPGVTQIRSVEKAKKKK
ncbi:MAG: sulfatase-like hydrolase/transferase [Phycisphaera sp.]|nr:sulfatase-like hydrolase/transferase [Phycisphaera sp.]